MQLSLICSLWGSGNKWGGRCREGVGVGGDGGWGGEGPLDCHAVSPDPSPLYQLQWDKHGRLAKPQLGAATG